MWFRCVKANYRKHERHLTASLRIISSSMKSPKTLVSMECFLHTWSPCSLTFTSKQKTTKWLVHLSSVAVSLLIKISFPNQLTLPPNPKKAKKNNKPSKSIREVFTRISLDQHSSFPLFSFSLVMFYYRLYIDSICGLCSKLISWNFIN